MAVNYHCTNIKVWNILSDLLKIKHTEFFNSSIFCVPYTTVYDADNAFFERRLDRVKLTFL